MKLVKPILGLFLLFGLISLVDTRTLMETLVRADLALFFVALLLGILANLLCVYRWKLIATQLGIQAPFFPLLAAYAQGISANSVLPGGILGGDAWRSLAIAKNAANKSKSIGALSVMLDRVSGFWSLTWLSLFAGLVVAILSAQDAHLFQPSSKASNIDLSQWIGSPMGKVYLLALTGIALVPFLGRLLHVGWLHKFECEHHHGLVGKLLKIVLLVINSLPILKKTFSVSVAVQTLAVSTFWLCLISVGIDVPWWILAALCGGVFLSGVLPASLGGFGARELGAVAFITPLGFQAEGVIAGSVLFGLTATIQGVMGLWFWFKAKDAPVKP